MKNLISISVVLALLISCQLEEPVEITKSQQIDKAESDANFRKSATFPEQIFIPVGFSPEGIESGKGSTFFVGSLYEGAIYKGDFRTGEGFILVPGQTGRAAVGLCYDERTDYLYVAGTFGVAFIYNGTTGEEVAEINLTTATFPSTLVNDCYVTKDVVYFTDSFQPVIYKVQLAPNGRLPETINVQIIPLSGEFAYIPGGINGNGITAPPNGYPLIIGNTDAGMIYWVDPETGDANQIDLGGETLPANDGFVLDGKTLYVVQNALNQVGVVQLEPDFRSGTIIRTITSSLYNIPATATLFGSRLYAVNAKFNDAPPPIIVFPPLEEPYNIEFDIIGVNKN